VYKFLPILLSLIICSFPAIAQVYKWVDESGVTHFSESPKDAPGEAYTVIQENKQKPGNDEVHSEARQDIQNKENAEEQETASTQQGWPECESELCAKVKKIDVNCTTQDCSDALKFSNDCKTMLCMGDRIDFEKKIDTELQRLANKNEVNKEPEEPVKEEKEIFSDKEILEKCKEERNVKCRKNIEYYRKIYNGTKEERIQAWQELRDSKIKRKEKK
jgi:hypothetical protein